MDNGRGVIQANAANEGYFPISINPVGGYNSTVSIGSYSSSAKLYVEGNVHATSDITTAGNVGIGTSSAEDTLHVEGGNILLSNVGGYINDIIYAETPSDPASNGNVVLRYDGVGSGAANKFYIGSLYPSWPQPGQGFTYQPSTGNVGIGVANPSAKLDVNGVTKNQNPSWSIYKVNSSTSGNNSGILGFNTNKVSAINCLFGSSTTTGGNRITITVAGRYFIGFQAFTESSVAIGSTMEYAVLKNGQIYIRNYHRQPYANYSAMGGLGCLMDLSVNDYVEIKVTQGTIHGNENASFYGFMIG